MIYFTDLFNLINGFFFFTLFFQQQRYNMMGNYNQYNQPYYNPPIGYGVNVNYNPPQSMMGPPYQNYGKIKMKKTKH